MAQSWRDVVYTRGGPKIGLDEGIFLGFTKGQWPIQAFQQEGQAAFWAAEKPDERMVVGPVSLPSNLPVHRGRKIPAEALLEEI